MKEEWVNTLRNRLGNHTVKAQDGLLDDIKQEMARRGIALASAPKDTPKVKPTGKQLLVSSAVVAAAVATAYVLWDGSNDGKAPSVAAIKTTKTAQKAPAEPPTTVADNLNGTPEKASMNAPMAPEDDLFTPFADAPFTAPAESMADHSLMPDNLSGEEPSALPTPPADNQPLNPAEKPAPQQPANEPAQPDNKQNEPQNAPDNQSSAPQSQPAEPSEAPSAPAKSNRPKLPLFSFGIGSGSSGFSAPVETTSKTITIPSPHPDDPRGEDTPNIDPNNPGDSRDGGGDHPGGTTPDTNFEGDHHHADDDEEPGTPHSTTREAAAIDGNESEAGHKSHFLTRATGAATQPSGNTTTAQEVRKVKHNQPIRMGFTFAIPLSSRMNLITGFTYNYLSSDISVTSPLATTAQKQKLYYLGIPVSVNYSFFSWKGLNLYGIAGGGVEKLVKGRLTGTTTTAEGVETRTSERIKESRPQFSVNASVGASYNFWGIMSAYIEPGVIYYFNNGSAIDNFYKANRTAFNFNVGLRLNLFK